MCCLKIQISHASCIHPLVCPKFTFTGALFVLTFVKSFASFILMTLPSPLYTGATPTEAILRVWSDKKRRCLKSSPNIKADVFYLHLQSVYALHSGTQLWGLNQGTPTVTHFPKLHLQLASCIFLQYQYFWQSLVNLQVFSFEVMNPADIERQIKIIICLILQLGQICWF